MGKDADNWAEEKRSAWLYRRLAGREAGTPREALFSRLAHEAEKQAALWENLSAERGLALPRVFRPGIRGHIVGLLIDCFPPASIRPILAAMKIRGLSLYSHGAPGHPSPQSLQDVGRRHRGPAAAGNLRAAVFGVSDGLVSNAALILGVAGARAEPALIVLSGAAGLLAGASSMAAGEYLSVRSQRELFEYQIGLEREELEEYPEEEAEELALIFEARGLPAGEAEQMAVGLIADKDKALDTLAREELGLNPDELGSPWAAAGFSFISFALGASIPLLPFFLARTGGAALEVSVAATAAALFGVGAALSLFTGKNAAYGGLRMLAIGGGAGALTYAIGSLLGVGLG